MIKFFYKILRSKNLNKIQRAIQNHVKDLSLSKMKLFVKIFNGAKSSTLDVWQGSAYASEIYWTDDQKTLKIIPENLSPAFRKSMKAIKTARRFHWWIQNTSLPSHNFDSKARHHLWSLCDYQYLLSLNFKKTSFCFKDSISLA